MEPSISKHFESQPFYGISIIVIVILTTKMVIAVEMKGGGLLVGGSDHSLSIALFELKFAHAN